MAQPIVVQAWCTAIMPAPAFAYYCAACFPFPTPYIQRMAHHDWHYYERFSDGQCQFAVRYVPAVFSSVNCVVCAKELCVREVQRHGTLS